MKTKLIIILIALFTLHSTVNAQGLMDKLKKAVNASANLSPEMLPESYEFNWLYKTTMTTQKKDVIYTTFMFNDQAKHYYGMEISNNQLKGKGRIIVVTDINQLVSTMFMMMAQEGGIGTQNMAQMTALPEDILDSNTNEVNDYKFREVPSKTILNRECKGIEMSNEEYKMTIYYALNAPVSFNNIFGHNSKNTPKGFDPTWLKKLENGLIMEMDCVNLKKSKHSFTMTANALEKQEKPLTIYKSNFEFMNGMAGMFKN